MSICTILGNGPTLEHDYRPPYSVLIGTNASYERIWSPIVCALEAHVAARAHSRANAFLYLVSRGCLDQRHSVAYFDQPRWAGITGAFAIWCAVKMGFNEINLAGFGGVGHFHGEDEKDREYQRKPLQQALDTARLNSVDVRLNCGLFTEVPEDFWKVKEPIEA